MSSFQRMVVIPQDEYLAMSTFQKSREPLVQHFYDLENRYNAEEKEKDPYRRMILQSNTLDQMKNAKEQIRNSLIISTPKPYQSRAKALLQTVEGFLRFNDKGEIYSDEGDIISGSRLEDLIQHAVRDRRRNLIPTGWSDFLSLLREHNVPRSILNRYTLDELEGTNTPVRPTLWAKRTNPKEEPSSSIKQIKTVSGVKREKPLRFQPLRSGKPSKDSFKPKRRKLTQFSFLKNYKNE